MIETVDFNDVVDFLEGPGVRKWQFRNEGIKLVNIRNLVDFKLDLTNTDKFLDAKEVSEKYKHFLLEEGDYVMASSGVTWGKIAEVEKQHLPLCLNTSIIKLKPKNQKLAKRYLWHFIKSSAFTNQIDRIITGSAQPNFGPSHLDKIKIPLPPHTEQKKIAALLDAADSLRQKDKALVAKYDELTQSLFLEMFGDPVRNEKGWDKLELKKMCSFLKTSIKPENISHGMKYVALDSIEKETGKIVQVYEPQDDEVKSNKFEFDERFILYGKLRPYLNKVALPDFKGICSTDIIPLRPIDNITNKYFIAHLMKGDWFVSYANERVAGANLPRISPSEIEKYLAINPPTKLQNQFAERVKAIEKQKSLVQVGLKKSEELFEGLLGRVFGKELD